MRLLFADNAGHVERPEHIAAFASNMHKAYENIRHFVFTAGLLKNFADFYNPNSKVFCEM